MARFCFVSLANVAHCDLGGMSFIRTAEELMRRGHEVEWVFSRRHKAAMQLRAEEFVERHAIPLGEPDDLILSVRGTPRQIVDSALALQDYVEAGAFDCMVVDRMCAVAPFSAYGAGTPWAVVGTDGRDWSSGPVDSRDGRGARGRLPGRQRVAKLETVSRYISRNDFPRPSTEGRWASSPFLNISFFPRAYYENGGTTALPDHSHFVGSGAYHPPLEARTEVLVTFGNTFDPSLRIQVAEELRTFLEASDTPVTMLTGKPEVTAEMTRILNGSPNLTIQAWVAYDEAYRTALAVVGHGGTSHLWYGMREGIPLIAVPATGDQVYGAMQAERMGIGRAALPAVDATGGPREASRHLGAGDLAQTIRAVLEDSEWAHAAAAVSQTMRAGGGVPASANLLERLAHERTPLIDCGTEACCC